MSVDELEVVVAWLLVDLYYGDECWCVGGEWADCLDWWGGDFFVWFVYGEYGLWE